MSRDRNKFSLTNLALACAGAGLTPLAIAQVAAPNAAASSPTSQTTPVKLENVSVTAERPKGFQTKSVQVGAFRDQEMLDVPLTVNVIPRAVLDAQDAHGLFDALRNTSGVARSQLNGSVYDNLSVRGVNFDNRTSYRLNGGLPIVNLIDIPLEDKERVEVLKGASSMYYGFASPVGIVNLVTKRAGPEPVTSFSLSGNQYGQAVAQVDIGRRFGDEGQYGARVNLVEGTLRNAIDGVKGSRTLGALALDWRANSTVSFHLDYENIRKDITEQAVIVAPGTGVSVATARILPALPDPKNLISGTWGTYDAYAENVVLRSDITIAENWTALVEWGRASTTRTRNELDVQGYDLVTGLSTKSAYYLTNHNVNTNTNLRIELTGRMSGFFLDHEFTLGFTDNERFNNAPAVPSNGNVTQNLYNPLVIPLPTITPTNITSPQSISDTGFYAIDRVRFGDGWQVIGGLRFEDYNDTKVANTATTSVTTAQKISPVSTSLALLYRVRPDTSLYASYIEGLEEGGVASAVYANAGEVLPAANSRQKEVGVRTEALHGVTGSLAYFELERAAAARNAANFYVLDGRTKYSGIEASASGEVVPQVSLTGAAMFLNAKLSGQTNTLWNGNAPDNTAKRTYSLFAEYRPGFVPGLGLSAGAYYISKRPLDNLDINYLPGYTIFTAGARYSTRIATKATTFQVNVENLGNKRYWSAANTGYIAEGLPLTVSFVVKVDL